MSVLICATTNNSKAAVKFMFLIDQLIILFETIQNYPRGGKIKGIVSRSNQCIAGLLWVETGSEIQFSDICIFSIFSIYQNCSISSNLPNNGKNLKENHLHLFGGGGGIIIDLMLFYKNRK